MSTHRFILEPYKGISTRHTCPNCHFNAFSMTTSGHCFAKRSMENIQRLTRDIFVGIDTIQAKTTITTKVTHPKRDIQ